MPVFIANHKMRDGETWCQMQSRLIEECDERATVLIGLHGLGVINLAKPMHVQPGSDEKMAILRARDRLELPMHPERCELQASGTRRTVLNDPVIFLKGAA